MITTRTTRARSSARRRTSVLALLVVGSLALAGCGDEESDTADDAPLVSNSPSPTPTGSPTEEESAPTFSESAFVYFAVETRTGLRLAREPRGTEGDGVGAVEAMISGPEDPDYSTSWNPDTEVLDISQTDDVITVDLSAEARDSESGSPAATLRAQQLVWTVTEVHGDEMGVELLIDGEPAGDFWGATDPVTRTPADDIRAFVGIDTPSEGETVGTTLEVEGEAIAGEGTVLWRVLDEEGTEMEAGFTTTSEGMTLAPYAFEVDLKPGTYTVEVGESDPSDGEGGAPSFDTRTITVE